MALAAPGWDKRSLSRFWPVSRPTRDAWIARWETAHVAGLRDKSRAPQAPARKGWRPLMRRVSHLPKRPPDAGGFRLGSLGATPEISRRTVARIMALNRPREAEIPPGRPAGATLPSPPHP